MSSVSSREQELEASLKDLLQTVLLYMENFIENQDDLKLIETELKDYDDLHELIRIIKTVFTSLTVKIDAKIGQRRIAIPQKKSNEYDKLEQIIQRHEAEIRNHIRNEHQMKLFADQLQQQLDESESTRKAFVAQTTKMINHFKRENVGLTSKLRAVQDENARLLQKVNDIGENQRQYDDKLVQIPEMKEYYNQKNKSAKKSSQISLGKEISDINQSTENAGISQVSTKQGCLTNSGSTPLKFARKQHARNELTRQRGTSMNIKREICYAGIPEKVKSHSLALSKHNSQEISLDQPKKSINNSFTGRARRNSTSEASQRKQKHFKDWQATLLRKCQIK